MNEQITLSGCVESIIYSNSDNGYTVFSFLAEEEIVCVGNIACLNEGEHLKLTGLYVMHSLYGRQLKVETYEKLMLTTEESLARYLGSGIIKGIGLKMAKRIVAYFGLNTFDIIENEPAKLTMVKGISEKKALAAAEEYNKHLELKNSMLYLHGLGLSTNHALKIYQIYKENTIDTVKTNPYKLADDIIGIGFKTADIIAEKTGVQRNSVYRVKSGIKYILSEMALKGHTYLPKTILTAKCAELLEIELNLMDEALTELQLEYQVVQKTLNEQHVIYLAYYFKAESFCAMKLAGLNAGTHEITEIEHKIEHFEAINNIRLADKQKTAVLEALLRDVLVITGGPGTGKTTVINVLIDILSLEEKKVLLAAPTGRAAKRMTEATGCHAQTIHRLLDAGAADHYSSQRFERNEENPLECDIIIIDEVSMVDILLFWGLLRAVPLGTKLILVGDADQLPSVGAGSVLSDIVESGFIKVVLLDEIFRQARLSAIVMNAHRINKGIAPIFNEEGSDFFFVKRADTQSTAAAVLELITTRLPEFTGVKKPTDIQVLTPMRKSALGVTELNRVLQAALNPESAGKKEYERRETLILRQGDKVMQIKNNYNVSWVIKNENGYITDEGTGIFNGEQGFITDMDEEEEYITVKFDDGKQVDYDYKMLDELELAYAITIHKSQGSEYPVVIIPILTGPPMLMTRNLLYTAVTRAKRFVVLVGSAEKIMHMVDNKMELARYSGLKDRIIQASNA
jgi:exodeoxyribonuclease V alpha subunit